MLPNIEAFSLFLFLIYSVAPPTSADGSFSNREYVKYLKYPPRIVIAPRDQTVVSGSIASFVCTAFGNPKPMIEWRKDNRRITTQRYTVQEMPNGSVLRIEPVRPERDISVYECVAENGVGEPAKAAAELKVLPEDAIPLGFPQFTMHPTMQGVEKGRTTLLYCQAEGNPTPTIYWLKNMVPVNLDDPRLNIIQGTYLQISEAKEEDQGTYQCVAENSVGSGFSNLASLYVKVRRVPPYFSIPPEPAYEIMPGSSLNLTCVAVGSPMPYVKWRKGSFDLTPENSLPVGKNVLQLENIRESANYTCVAASKLGNIETVTAVLVQALPRPPKDLRISDVTARSIRLSWSYDIGAENIKYYVIQYKPKQANQEYSELSGIVTTFYTVSDLVPYTEYEFHVIAVNAIGRGSPSTPAVITTGETMEPSGASKPGSAPRNVQARPLSSSTVVIQWDPPKEPNGQVTGYKVYFTTRPNLPTTNWNTQNVDSSTLTTISDMTPQTIYTIRIQAFTSRGSGPLSAPVQVKTQQGVPSQPSNLLAKSTSSTTVQLQWSHPEHSGESVIGYELYWNDTFTQQQYHRTIPAINSYTLSNLYPDTVYHIWVAAKSKRGEGAATPPVNVKTDQYLPGAPPQEIHGSAVSSRSLLITWKPPPLDQQNGQITYYKIKYLKASTSDDPQKARQIQTGPDERSFIIDGLEKWTKYHIWVLAGTVVGDGPLSAPLIVQTDEDVPGEPRNVKVEPVNSTSLQVQWKPPANKDRNGLIRGYQIHIQEKDKNNDLVGEPIRYDVANEEAEAYNVTGLQPDTTYAVQVAAVTRKGDGTRSHPRTAKTRGGVPTKPELNIRVISENPRLKVEVSWDHPRYIYGDLLGYRLHYKKQGAIHSEKKVINPHDQHTTIDSLDRGATYEFRLAGRNSLGWGQEAIVHMETPEGVPTAPPQNITHYLQSPTTLVIRWNPPLSQYSNGRVIQYGILFHKASEDTTKEKNITAIRSVFSSLDENTKYVFRVRAYTLVGPGPWSSRLIVDTQGDGPSAPTNVQAMATSDQSLEVWWDEVPYFPDILGYQILYTQTAVADLELWRRKKVPLTWSAELTALDSHATYSIRVAAYTKPERLGHLSEVITVTIVPTDVPTQLRAHGVTTHSMILSWRHPQKLNPIQYKVSFGAHKEFHDSQRVLQTLTIPTQAIFIESNRTEYKIDDLMPFTTYQVNITAIPPEGSYRPPAKISVTTARAAPKPMVKPDTVGVSKENEIILILPQASEEFGLISHYFLVVVPAEEARDDPDTYTIEELNNLDTNKPRPYIAAKFLPRDMPKNFPLGDNNDYGGYNNKQLQHNQKYRIFMRAVVDTPQKNLYTSSPLSDILSLDMVLSGQSSLPGASGGDRTNKMDIHLDSSTNESGVVWVVVPIILCLLFILGITIFIIVKRRRQLSKASVGETTNKLLVNSADRDFTTHPTDPVELRRLNYQTPAMINHPPIPVTELANHIERLKASDNQKFSQEYESIEPGQQFTWENSNLEVNKPKNRYANVIAYDHSRVVLQIVDGIPGTDYINANYCDGYRKQNAYIATQGPLSETVGDFWRMVWEQRSATIVMMTKLEERTRIKCDQYWPLRGTEMYGMMNVGLVDIQELATYCIRTFVLHKLGYPEKREVRQFQFTAWPDHGVPEHPSPFLTFLQRIHSLNPSDAGPIVIHCSAGVGRTGVFISLSIVLERMQDEGVVDIFQTVRTLRTQRPGMVQTEDQYRFCYSAGLEYLGSFDHYTN
ncbi:tyrosine-protein phosphatase Lar-like isoform X3 [Limulus polyphemus]|uniref:protein-tyrosine-phosphatase n=1 Tax=Limulus polyphemus TaxID=6850 RepID=A0ABM1SW03_LIMPO|nr:tyrosine-protein phosphatase Lar-like isoform X3 [Limulus polyphemus]